MGVSTDGVLLVYGIDLSAGDEGYAVKVPWSNTDKDREDMTDEEIDTEDDADFESWWAKENGVSNKELWKEYYAWKTGDYNHDSKGVEVFEKNNPTWRRSLDKHYKDKKRVQEACPVEEVIHCSYDYPMYILAVKGHTTSASRGYPEAINSLELDEKAVQKAKEFCEKYNIKWEPKWYLTSLWG